MPDHRGTREGAREGVRIGQGHSQHVDADRLEQGWRRQGGGLPWRFAAVLRVWRLGMFGMFGMLIGRCLVMVVVGPEEKMIVVEGVSACQMLVAEGDVLQPDGCKTCGDKKEPNPPKRAKGANVVVPIQGWHRQSSSRSGFDSSMNVTWTESRQAQSLGIAQRIDGRHF